MIRHFHSPAAASFDRFRYWFYWCLFAAAVMIVLAVLKVAARGGCSLPPELPQNFKRDRVCVLLGRGPDCRIRVKDTFGARIISDEVTYSVFIADEFVGTFLIADGMPIDPSLLTKELVENSLVFQTGDAELQQRFRTFYHCRKVAYVDRVLEWHLGETQILVACAS